MKKTITFLFFISLFLLAGAQDVKFGVYLTPKFTWLSPDSKNVDSDGSIFKFGGGLAINKYFAENYAFTSGIGIGGQGGKINYETGGNTLQVYDSVYNIDGKTIKYNLQYISIPLGLRLQSNEIGYIKFFVNLGLNNQLNIKATATDKTGGEFDDDSISDEVNLYNLCYYFGGGIDYAIGEDTSLFIAVNYDNGFLRTFKAGPQINSRVISIQVGVNF